MTTYILPGFSLKNKGWAETVARKLNSPQEVVHWPHWDSSSTSDNWKQKEADKLASKITQPSNIIAKSIGTLVTALLVQKASSKLNKIILCGIPTNDIEKSDLNFYEILGKLDPKRLLIIQNDEDPHGSFEQIKKLITPINSDIKIVSKTRNDHEYPYYDDFNIFLTS